MTTPATLDHAGIAARIPHSGRMCLLHALQAWTDERIRCSAVDHASLAHPLRLGDMLPAPVAVEYAAQAMALHGTLCATPGAAPRPGFLAAVRGLRLCVSRLDDAPGPLRIDARRLAGDGGQALYAFAMHDAQDRLLVEGRATVILNALP